jgi:uncharacterized protein YuzE
MADIQDNGMKYRYDREVDILTIRIRDGSFADGDEVAPGLVAAFDEDGNLLELELRNIRKIAESDFDSSRLRVAA